MVGVDRPMKALSMHIQKPYYGKIVIVLIAVILSKIIFFNQTPSCICFVCLFDLINNLSVIQGRVILG